MAKYKWSYANVGGVTRVRIQTAEDIRHLGELDKKKWLASHFGAGACDMEGGAVAQVCLEYGTPYAAFRALSDTLTGNGKEYEENVHDACAASAALLTALLLFLAARFMGKGDASTVVARVRGKVVLQKPLLVDGRYEIPLPAGETNIIRVEQGAVWMEEANCRDGLCIHQGKMRNRAKSIVCLPHNLVITLEGDSGAGETEPEDLDVIIY